MYKNGMCCKTVEQAHKRNRHDDYRCNPATLAYDNVSIFWPVKVNKIQFVTTTPLEITDILARMVKWSIKCFVKSVRDVSVDTLVAYI